MSESVCAAGRALCHPDLETGFHEPCRQIASRVAVVVQEDINEFVYLCGDHYGALHEIIQHYRFPVGDHVDR